MDERTNEQTNERTNVTALPVWLPPDDAAALLGCSVRHLQKLHKSDPQKWPRRRVGRHSEYRVARTDERTFVRASVATHEQTNEQTNVRSSVADADPTIASLVAMLEHERQAHEATRAQLAAERADHDATEADAMALVEITNRRILEERAARDAARDDAQRARLDRERLVSWLRGRGLWAAYLDDHSGAV